MTFEQELNNHVLKISDDDFWSLRCQVSLLHWLDPVSVDDTEVLGYPNFTWANVKDTSFVFVEDPNGEVSNFFLLHRWVWFRNFGPLTSDQWIYHKDGDTFNNTPENLDWRITQKSPYKGATWDKRSKKWRSQIWLNGKVKQLGHYGSPEEASIEYYRFKELYADQRKYKTS